MNKIIPLRGDAGGVELSVIVPVTDRFDDPAAVYQAYRRALRSTGRTIEFIYVLDTPCPAMTTCLEALRAKGEPITIVQLSQRFGEAVSMEVGVQRARGALLLMLPPYLQIDPAGLPTLIAALARADLVAAVRNRRGDHVLSRIRAWTLSQVARIAGSRMEDLGCLVIACHRRVLAELVLQDEHHRFLALLAQNAGFVVEHITLPQATSDRRFRLHGPSVYLGRVLDLLAIAFLLRFMQQPFRFFGSIGAAMTASGTLLGAYLAMEKLVMNVPLAERPALLLATLLVVLGVQIAAVGLIAEIIIFTRSSKLATYRIDQVVEQTPTHEVTVLNTPVPTPAGAATPPPHDAKPGAPSNPASSTG
jgi:hypothetical protein